eukprot:Blabericola_migrator_1__1550@NODE_140_length_13109_cov_183_610106_g122_i0_p6_GENE_NODE_140_length_13109_cov_183_610106_g122_i0NODE_140_length_13109_cov_183_610106_g122_i0_p6_ORF_typecomplete_len207_score35_97_NODE_140_length_13109_cov_183_610106_g122_i02622
MVAVFVLLVSLLCTFLAVLNVYAGYNRRTIHSIVIKLFLTYSATLKTIEGAAKQVLAGTVGSKILGRLLGVGGGLQGFQFIPVQCVYNAKGTSDFPTRFFVTCLTYCLLPVLCIVTSTIFSAIFYMIVRSHFLEKTKKQYKLVSMLKLEGLDEIAARVTKELEGLRIVMIWRYAEFNTELSLLQRVRRFVKDMVSGDVDVDKLKPF